ncbi:MAG: hypothetical protein XE03_1741 [candidate division TA06 bacterium 34_109]|jgi:hypothetical protein|uniref:Uncharacterized protein n=1 Tax=candidate division TA06 bacterium 34_109 TaxID=1635277 RepID=A0A101I0B2_UNCT6|nr:MAG: hypothetical protein XE03_1741 [candidate division TA06 bacterium 34_109]
MEKYMKGIKIFWASYRDLFLLLGIIILVWAIVALTIKIFIRKSERLDDSEEDMK